MLGILVNPYQFSSSLLPSVGAEAAELPLSRHSLQNSVEVYQKEFLLRSHSVWNQIQTLGFQQALSEVEASSVRLDQVIQASRRIAQKHGLGASTYFLEFGVKETFKDSHSSSLRGRLLLYSELAVQSFQNEDFERAEYYKSQAQRLQLSLKEARAENPAVTHYYEACLQLLDGFQNQIERQNSLEKQFYLVHRMPESIRSAVVFVEGGIAGVVAWGLGGKYQWGKRAAVALWTGLVTGVLAGEAVDGTVSLLNYSLKTWIDDRLSQFEKSLRTAKDSFFLAVEAALIGKGLKLAGLFSKASTWKERLQNVASLVGLGVFIGIGREIRKSGDEAYEAAIERQELDLHFNYERWWRELPSSIYLGLLLAARRYVPGASSSPVKSLDRGNSQRALPAATTTALAIPERAAMLPVKNNVVSLTAVEGLESGEIQPASESAQPQESNTDFQYEVLGHLRQIEGSPSQGRLTWHNKKVTLILTERLQEYQTEGRWIVLSNDRQGLRVSHPAYGQYRFEASRAGFNQQQPEKLQKLGQLQAGDRIELVQPVQGAEGRLSPLTDYEQEFVDQLENNYQNSATFQDKTLEQAQMAELLAEVKRGTAPIGVLADYVFHVQVQEMLQNTSIYYSGVQVSSREISVSELAKPLVLHADIDFSHFRDLDLDEFAEKYRASSEAKHELDRLFDRVEIPEAQRKEALVPFYKLIDVLEKSSRSGNADLASRLQKRVDRQMHPELLHGYEIRLNFSKTFDISQKKDFLDPRRLTLYMNHPHVLQEGVSLAVEDNRHFILRWYPPRTAEILRDEINGGHGVASEYGNGSVSVDRINDAGQRGHRFESVALDSQWLSDIKARIPPWVFNEHDRSHAEQLSEYAPEARRVLYQVLWPAIKRLPLRYRALADRCDIPQLIADAVLHDRGMFRIIFSGVEFDLPKPQRLDFIQTLRSELPKEDRIAYEEINRALQEIEQKSF